MFAPLRRIFGQVVANGNLTVIDCDGRSYHFGDKTGCPVVIRFTDRRLEWGLAFNPHLALGESYMAGRLIFEGGTIYEFLEIMLSCAARQPFPRWMSAVSDLRRLSKRVQQLNPILRAKANAAYHYDIDGSIYDLFLDSDRQYSCAYFQNIDDLEDAQRLKKRHIAAKLALTKGQRLLDIGSGWGGLGLYLAKVADVDVTGITLSAEQLRVSQARSEQSGLKRHVRFKIQDFRQIEGRFDRIVSIGMFEHVGVNHYRSYFQKLQSLLASDGVALLHFIGRSDRPTITNPFIAKYIFPGGYIPALSEVLPAIERSGLIVTDIEVLRLHYAETLRHWRQRFAANRRAAVGLRGEEFCRMWEFYLAASETAFRHQGLVVFQVQLTKQQDVLPLTRDYIHAEEDRLVECERAPAARMKQAS